MMSVSLLVWRFLSVKPRFYPLVEGHVSIVSYVSYTSSEPFPIALPILVLVELGLLSLGVGSYYAYSYHLFRALEFPLDAYASPCLRGRVLGRTVAS